MLPQKFILGKDFEISYVEGTEVSTFWEKGRCIEFFLSIFYFRVVYLIVGIQRHCIC
jgi:hypothetical protein